MNYLRKRPWKEIIDTVKEQGRVLGQSSFFIPSSYDPEIVKGVAQFCQEWSEAVDAIVITGDIATTGLTIDLEVAEKFIKAPASEGFMSAARFPTISSLGLPIHVFAGNHDRYLNVRGRPYSNQFDFAFEEYMDKRSQFIGSWVSDKDGRQIAFVHADFTIQSRLEAEYSSRLTAYGQGRIYDDVLADLRAETFRLRGLYDSIPIIWMIHFAPYECGTSLRLIDHQKFIDAAKAIGVVATICGHTHESRSKSIDRHKIFCGGSACCVENVDGCKVHILDFEIDERCIVSRSTFKWSEQDTQFVFHGND